MSKLPRDVVRKIKRMDGEDMFAFWRDIYEQGYEEGYADGLTVDLDSDAVVMDEDEVRRRLTDEEFARLIGGL